MFVLILNELFAFNVHMLRFRASPNQNYIKNSKLEICMKTFTKHFLDTK